MEGGDGKANVTFSRGHVGREIDFLAELGMESQFNFILVNLQFRSVAGGGASGVMWMRIEVNRVVVEVEEYRDSFIGRRRRWCPLHTIGGGGGGVDKIERSEKGIYCPREEQSLRLALEAYLPCRYLGFGNRRTWSKRTETGQLGKEREPCEKLFVVDLCQQSMIRVTHSRVRPTKHPQFPISTALLCLKHLSLAVP